MKYYIYKTYIRPVLLYGAPIFSTTCNTNINKLQVLQNKILRIIQNKTNRTKITLLHNTAGMPLIEDVIHNNTYKFYMYTINKNELTSQINLYNKNTAPFKIKYKLPHTNIIN